MLIYNEKERQLRSVPLCRGKTLGKIIIWSAVVLFFCFRKRLYDALPYVITTNTVSYIKTSAAVGAIFMLLFLMVGDNGKTERLYMEGVPADKEKTGRATAALIKKAILSTAVLAIAEILLFVSCTDSMGALNILDAALCPVCGAVEAYCVLEQNPIKLLLIRAAIRRNNKKQDKCDVH